jgi:hypothetical protein
MFPRDDTAHYLLVSAQEQWKFMSIPTTTGSEAAKIHGSPCNMFVIAKIWTFLGPQQREGARTLLHGEYINNIVHLDKLHLFFIPQLGEETQEVAPPHYLKEVRSTTLPVSQVGG